MSAEKTVRPNEDAGSHSAKQLRPQTRVSTAAALVLKKRSRRIPTIGRPTAVLEVQENNNIGCLATGKMDQSGKVGNGEGQRDVSRHASKSSQQKQDDLVLTKERDVKGKLGRSDMVVPVSDETCCGNVCYEGDQSSRTTRPSQAHRSYHGCSSPCGSRTVLSIAWRSL